MIDGIVNFLQTALSVVLAQDAVVFDTQFVDVDVRLKGVKRNAVGTQKVLTAGVDLKIEGTTGSVEQNCTVEFSNVGNPINLFFKRLILFVKKLTLTITNRITGGLHTKFS